MVLEGVAPAEAASVEVVPAEVTVEVVQVTNKGGLREQQRLSNMFTKKLPK